MAKDPAANKFKCMRIGAARLKRCVWILALTPRVMPFRGVEALRTLGIQNAILNAGGDLRGFGRRGIRPLHIGIRHPRAPGVFASVEIETDENILTSGDYERFFIYNRKRYHHVIDPRTGYPAREAVCATVIHPSAARIRFRRAPCLGKLCDFAACLPNGVAVQFVAKGTGFDAIKF